MDCGRENQLVKIRAWLWHNGIILVFVFFFFLSFFVVWGAGKLSQTEESVDILIGTWGFLSFQCISKGFLSDLISPPLSLLHCLA
jgi:hypothetical protein